MGAFWLLSHRQIVQSLIWPFTFRNRLQRAGVPNSPAVFESADAVASSNRATAVPNAKFLSNGAHSAVGLRR